PARREPRIEPDFERRREAPDAHAEGNRAMFDRIAPGYDRMNRLMSLGIDRRWRRRAVEVLRAGIAPADPARPAILDLCAGTLDLAAALEETFPHARIVACDASARMLDLGRPKVRGVEIV